MSSTANGEPIRLRCSQNDAQVVVDPEDEDEFFMRIHEAMRACRIYDGYKSIFRNEFDYLKGILGRWLRDHASKIEKAFLTLQKARMLFLVIMCDGAYDEELEDELTDLELRVALDPEFSQIHLDVQALSKSSENCCMSFCNPDWTLEYVMPDA